MLPLVLVKISISWHEKICFSVSATGLEISTGEIKHFSVVEKRQESHLTFHFCSECLALWPWHKPTLKITMQLFIISKAAKIFLKNARGEGRSGRFLTFYLQDEDEWNFLDNAEAFFKPKSDSKDENVYRSKNPKPRAL